MHHMRVFCNLCLLCFFSKLAFGWVTPQSHNWFSRLVGYCLSGIQQTQEEVVLARCDLLGLALRVLVYSPRGPSLHALQQGRRWVGEENGWGECDLCRFPGYDYFHWKSQGWYFGDELTGYWNIYSSARTSFGWSFCCSCPGWSVDADGSCSMHRRAKCMSQFPSAAKMINWMKAIAWWEGEGEAAQKFLA